MTHKKETKNGGFKKGDHVEYHPIGGANENVSKTTGVVVDILTEDQPAGSTGVHAHASQQDPRFVIKNDHTQKETAYKAHNIIRKLEESEY